MNLVCGMCFKLLAKRLPNKLHGIWVECPECHEKALWPDGKPDDYETEAEAQIPHRST